MFLAEQFRARPVAAALQNCRAMASQEELVELLIDGARYGDMEDVEAALSQSVPIDSKDAQGRTGMPGWSLCLLKVIQHCTGCSEAGCRGARTSSNAVACISLLHSSTHGLRQWARRCCQTVDRCRRGRYWWQRCASAAHITRVQGSGAVLEQNAAQALKCMLYPCA